MTCRVGVLRGWRRIHVGDLLAYSELRRYGYAVELVCSTTGEITEADARMPLRRLRGARLLGPLSQWRPGGYAVGLVSPYGSYAGYLHGFAHGVRDLDVLCGLDPVHPSSYQAIRERRHGKKVVIQCWDNIPYNWPADRPVREHFEAVLDEADYFLPFSRDAERTLRAMGVRSDRMTQVNMGLDTDRWTPAPAERTPHEALRVLYVGQLTYRKGVPTLLEAVELADVPIELTIVGTGPVGPRLRWLLQQRQQRTGSTLADRVRLVGPQYGDALLRLRQRSDVQVVPSVPDPNWREQLSQAMLEGMACGLPPVASECGAVPEVVTDGVEGLLVPPDLPQAFAEAFVRLARDPERRLEMGRRARARIVRDYEYRRQGERLAEIFRTKIRAP